MKFFFLAAAFLLAVPPVYAVSFGDDVAACAAKYGVPADSPDLPKVFAVCEERVTAARSAADRAVAVVLFRECLQTTARQLDDRLSPASDIARATAFKCREQWKTLMLASGASAKGADEYPSVPLTEAALTSVLEARAAPRGKKL